MRPSNLSLLNALEFLRRSGHELSRTLDQRCPRAEEGLEKLRTTVNKLSECGPPRPLISPKEYKNQWELYLNRKCLSLELRAIRYLCWEPDIATDSRFQHIIDTENVRMSAQSLQGLVRSCHARWTESFSNGSLVVRVKDRIKNYIGPNRLLRKWQSALFVVLGQGGPKEIAGRMVQEKLEIHSFCSSWGVDPQTPYFQEAIKHVVNLCRSQLKQKTELRKYLIQQIFPWSDWKVEALKIQIGETILHPAVNELPEFQESLKAFVLKNTQLGDPRLPRNRMNWIGVSDQARIRFIQWLSITDVKFFFEHVLPPGEDPHCRKPFWLEYVPRIIMSRPLLNRDDEFRLQGTIRRIGGQIGNYGFIAGATSAFLLDFGSILIVEFSKPGNACYIYEKTAVGKLIENFWNNTPFLIDRGDFKLCLKQKTYIGRVVHRDGWEEEMSQILAHHGVRP